MRFSRWQRVTVSLKRQVLIRYYKKNDGTSRPKVKVNKEVKEAMETHDVDKSGTLEVPAAPK
jgi:hypothetical protein